MFAILWRYVGFGEIMITELENRLQELKQLLTDLAPKTGSQSESVDYLQAQTYVLGYQEAARICLKHMGWIAVEDQLPDDFEEVLYYATADNGMSREIMTGHREKGQWTHCCLFYSTHILNDNVTVTHWMPLPNYPRGK